MLGVALAGALTYMSIEEEIKDRCRRGMLFPLIPIAPGASVRRALFVAEDLWSVLQSPEGDAEWEERIGNLIADLENFVTADEISPRYLFLLSPARDCVWEIRSVVHQPSIRVLGQFGLKDILVTTNFALREDLGAWNSPAWREVKRRSIAIWRALFTIYKPVQTVNVSDVVSGATNGKYVK